MATAQRADAPHSARTVTSEILDRLPPQNLDAEKAVLGSLLIDPNLCDEVALILRPDDFYADAHRKIYGQMLGMHDEGGRIDAMLLVERLKTAGELEAVGGMAYLAEVAQSVPVAAHAIYYGQIVQNKSTLRALIHASTEILRDAYDPTREPQELVSEAEQKVFAVHDQRTASQVNSMYQVLEEAFKQIDQRLEGGPSGTPTGFRDLDNLTGGLHDSELIILAARPSMGKTALAMNIAENVSIKSRVTTLYVSLEMSRTELAQRMLCSQGKIDGRKFRAGFVSAKEKSELVKASAILSNAPLFIDDTPTRNVTQIAATARRLKRKQKLGLVIIDYLQLIEPDNSRDQRQEQVAKIARRLKGMARELKIPVLCLAQLNRQVDAGGKEGHRPRLSHLRESGAIEQDADVVMFIHRDDYYLTREEAEKERKAGLADLMVAKQRNGATDDIKLAWFKQFTRFEDLSEKSYDEFEPYEDF